MKGSRFSTGTIAYNIPKGIDAFALVLIILLALVSCKKETLEVEPPSFTYFPVEKGKYVIYNIDSVVHGTNDNNNDDSVYYYHFQIKEVIDTPFQDLEGRMRQVIVRYYRQDTSEAWSIRNVWSQWLSSQYAYRYEDNIAYHKMSFPISEEITWDYNDMNTLTELTFEFHDIHQSASLGGFEYDSTVTVVLKDWEDYNNPVERIFEQETYAAGVGVVYKRSDNLRKNAGVVVSGTEYVQVVAGYGTE